MDMECIKQTIGKIKEIEKICGSVSNLEYELKCLIEAHRLLLTEYVPFKVGDRVELAQTPQTPEIACDSGWNCSKHFLVEGTAGTVKSSEVTSSGTVWYNVEFDDESWKDGKIVHPITTGKHTYNFKKEFLRPWRQGREELLPCPFCGSKAEEYDRPYMAERDSVATRAYVLCHKCVIDVPKEAWQFRVGGK